MRFIGPLKPCSYYPGHLGVEFNQQVVNACREPLPPPEWL
jgi:hypothetical protein